MSRFVLKFLTTFSLLIYIYILIYIASGLNVKLVLQAMVERNASQREVEEVACSMVPKNK